MADLSSSFSKVCEQFKFSELNKHKKEAIISAVLKKKDVFDSLPTGFGKSVIFQALPMVFDGCRSFYFFQIGTFQGMLWSAAQA